VSWLVLGTIAVAVAMDAFAASVSSGIAIHRIHVRHALLIASFFGTFQAVMPLIGWLAGHASKVVVSAFDHWLAFGLLAFIGGKAIWTSLRRGPDEARPSSIDVRVLTVLALATSIDALAVGLSLSYLDVSITRAALLMGVVTFAGSFLGVYVGDMIGHLFERPLEALSGLVLVGIGVRILLQHLFFA
jgi:putative Mn2+ efflux pump MntP